RVRRRGIARLLRAHGSRERVAPQPGGVMRATDARRRVLPLCAALAYSWPCVRCSRRRGCSRRGDPARPARRRRPPMIPPRSSVWDAVGAIREQDDRLRQETYGFVVAALEWTVRHLPADRQTDPVRRHLSGAELLAGIAAFARQEFGPLAPAVF